jgi:hypothetical protein
MLPVFRANKRATQNVNQKVARVDTALCAVFSSASLRSDAPQGRGYRISKQSFAQRNAQRKVHYLKNA